MEKKKNNPLLVEAAHQQIEFLKTELDLAFTFIHIAQTKSSSRGDPAHAEQAATKAREAYSAIIKHLPKVKMAEQERQGLNKKIHEFERAMAELPS